MLIMLIMFSIEYEMEKLISLSLISKTKQKCDQVYIYISTKMYISS